MKKYLLAFVLVFLLVSPVVADAPVNVIVDGKALSTPGVLINDTTYVPLRAISDMYGATTDWHDYTVTIKTKTVDIKDIQRPAIKGDDEFVTKINAALDLLEQKDFPHYLMVCQNTYNITQLTKKPPNDPDNLLARSFFSATVIYPKLTADSKRYTPEYLTGLLVHEACHNTITNYDREQSEKICYAHELEVFKLLDAPQWMQDDCINR